MFAIIFTSTQSHFLSFEQTYSGSGFFKIYFKIFFLFHLTNILHFMRVKNPLKYLQPLVIEDFTATSLVESFDLSIMVVIIFLQFLHFEDDARSLSSSNTSNCSSTFSLLLESIASTAKSHSPWDVHNV